MRWLRGAAVGLGILGSLGSPAYAKVTPDDANYIVTVTHDVPGAAGATTQAPGRSTGDAHAQPPQCNAVAIGVACTMVTVCEPDPSFGGTHALHQYGGVLIHGWPYGVTGPCEPSDATAQPSLPGLVLQAFERVPLPQPVLSIQPPKGNTLVGLETIFSTKAEPFTRTLNLLGRRVELRIKASNFAWDHGDGTTRSTDWAGKAWDHDQPDIDGYLTHVYEHTGTVRPRVSVTWSAEYRVDGGAWQAVNGTVTRKGAPAELVVVEGQPVLNAH